jgi:2-O-methyltransferase
MVSFFKKIKRTLKAVLSKEKILSLEDYRAFERSKAYLRRFVPKDAVIVEAGAHIGTDTVEMARLWPDVTIHAFEPLPEMFSILRTNTKTYSNVICYPLALSDKNGSALFHVSEGTSDASSSLLPPKEHLKSHPTVTFTKKIKVKTITLDTWAKKYNVQKVDFMWLDMQGAESKVLKASKKILPRVGLIYAEVSLKELYKGVDLYPSFKKWMFSKGFYPQLERLDWSDGGDVLFKNINDTMH